MRGDSKVDLAAAVTSATTKAVLLSEIVKVLSIHPGFPRRSADIAVVTLKQPRDITTLEL